MKNLIFILIFFVGFYQTNHVFALAKKTTYLTNQFPNHNENTKHKKKHTNIFSVLRTRYLANSTYMVFAQMKTALFAKKNSESTGKWAPFIIIGFGVLAILSGFYFVSIGMELWLALLAGLGIFAGLFFIYLCLAIAINGLRC